MMLRLLFLCIPTGTTLDLHEPSRQILDMYKSILAIIFGAALGALLRWVAGTALNGMLSGIPLGTLLVNVSGSFCMGFVLRIFEELPGVAPEWKLFICTGFLGALTTFSSFSAEIGMLIQQQRLVSAFSGILLHVAGSLIAFFFGIWICHILYRIQS